MRPISLTVLLLSVACAAGSPAGALAGAVPFEITSGSLKGRSLDVSITCVKSLDIRADESLKDHIAYDASAVSEAEFDRLEFVQGDTARITSKQPSTGCRMGGGVASGSNTIISNSGSITVNNGVVITNGKVVTAADLPEATLRLIVRVPVGTPIRLDLSGQTDTTVGDVRGPLKARLSGASDVHTGAIGALDLALSGSGTLSAREVTGNVRASISGAGSLDVQGGQIGDVDASVSGTGNVIIAAPVRDADLSVSGVGKISVGEASGSVHRKVSGVGKINVGRQ